MGKYPISKERKQGTSGRINQALRRACRLALRVFVL